jgi:regulator of ribonuclease activity A
MNAVTFSTTDLLDAHEADIERGTVRVLQPALLALGRARSFAGEVVTLKLFEDNSLLAELVKTPGNGRVIVVDAGGSLRCAVFGGNLATAAARNGWSGVVIYGCARDADEIDACELGVRALALHPRRSIKRGEGQGDLAVSFLGATVRPGNWLYADRDGVVVSDRPLHAA